MSWLSNFVRPKIRALVKKSDAPNNLWIKCKGCEQMVYHKDLKETLNVCPTCGHHMKMSASQRINWVLDEGTIKEISLPQTLIDPLKFKDNKKYMKEVKKAREYMSTRWMEDNIDFYTELYSFPYGDSNRKLINLKNGIS